jgi:hypothetical protein
VICKSKVTGISPCHWRNDASQVRVRRRTIVASASLSARSVRYIAAAVGWRRYGSTPCREHHANINFVYFTNALKRCAGEIAATIGAAQVFVDKVFATFGPRLTAAISGASFASFSLWEAVGVSLGTIAASELVGVLVAAGVTITVLFPAYTCVFAGGL